MAGCFFEKGCAGRIFCVKITKSPCDEQKQSCHRGFFVLCGVGGQGYFLFRRMARMATTAVKRATDTAVRATAGIGEAGFCIVTAEG